MDPTIRWSKSQLLGIRATITTRWPRDERDRDIHTAPLRFAGGEVHLGDMKLYKIEKGIKLPAPSRPKSSGHPSRAAATMQALAVGDSFFIRDPLDAIRAEKTMRDMKASARDAGRPHVLTSRRTRGGLRVWRLR